MKKNELTKQEKQAHNIFFQRNHFYGKIFLFALCGAVMIGHGARMLYQGIFVPGSSYSLNTFDLFFDWLTLCILGVFLFCFAVYRFYITTKTLTTKKGSGLPLSFK